MYLEWPRLQWIVDKNCIFHRRCFNYAKDSFPKNSKPLQTRSSSSQWKSAWIHKKWHGEYKSVIVGSLRGLLFYLPAVPALSYTGPSSRVRPQSQLCHTTKIYICSLQCRARLHCTNLYSLTTDLMHFQVSLPIQGAPIRLIFAQPTAFVSFLTRKHFPNKTLCQILYSWTNACITLTHLTGSRPAGDFHPWLKFGHPLSPNF